MWAVTNRSSAKLLKPNNRDTSSPVAAAAEVLLAQPCRHGTLAVTSRASRQRPLSSRFRFHGRIYVIESRRTVGQLPMRQHSLCRAKIASCNLCVPLHRVPEAVFFRLRDFIHRNKKCSQAVDRHATLLVAQNRVGTHARMRVLLQLWLASLASEQRASQHTQHQGW